MAKKKKEETKFSVVMPLDLVDRINEWMAVFESEHDVRISRASAICSLIEKGLKRR